MMVLPRIRDWFPDARILGWKYELAGTRDEAFAKAWKQLLWPIPPEESL